MQLVVARGDVAVRIDDKGPVGHAPLVDLDAKRADMKPNAELRGERAQALKLHALGFGRYLRQHALRLEFYQRRVLRRLHVVGATACRLPDQRLGLIEIGRNAAARPELDQRRAEASARAHGSLVSATGGSCASQASSSSARSSATSSS